MKTRIYSVLAGILLTAKVFAQVPKKMIYQVLISNTSNALVTSASVSMKINIIQDSSTGTLVYVETQTITTNANGLVSLEIGSGMPVTGTFSDINWATDTYFIKIETEPISGTSYNIIDTNKLISGAYALFKANATLGFQGSIGLTCPKVSFSGFTHCLGEAFNGGIIFELYKGSDGSEHGLVVALTERTIAWQASDTLVNANRTADVAYNNGLIKNSLAADYVATLGSGWYLPGIKEIGKLYRNHYYVQKGLLSGGNTLLSNTITYWSSSEYYAINPYIFFLFNGVANYFKFKTNTFTVRGVKAF